MKNLTKEQIISIPELRRTMTVEKVASELGVGTRTIYYWIDRLKKAGHTVPSGKVGKPKIQL